MNHAPGPWSIKKNFGSDRIIDAHGKPVCRIEPDPTASDNARLIAAAPELLEACKRLMKYPNTYRLTGCGNPVLEKDMADAQAAIDKAEKGE